MRENAASRLTIIRLWLALVLALMPCLVSNSCAPKKPIGAVHDVKGLSARAAADYYYLVYQDLQRAGRKDEAVLVLQTLSDLAPTPQMHLELANLYWGLNLRENSTEVLETGVERFPDDKKLHLYLGNAYQLRRMYDEAVRVLADYRRSHPDDIAVIQEIAAVLIEAERFDEAVEVLADVQDKDLTPAMLYYRSKAYGGLDRREEAVAALKKALEKDPNLLAAWAELGYLQELQHDYKAAEQTYKRILELGEEGAEVWLRLIRLNLKLGRPGKAMKLLEQAPEERGFIFEAISAFIDEGRTNEARKLLDRISREDPDNPDLLFYRAVLAYEGEKNLEKAYAILEEVPSSHPHYDKSLTFRIQLALEMDNPKQATALVGEGKELYPDKKNFWNLEAAVYDRLGNTLLSSQVLRKAVDLWPEDTDILYRYGAALEKLGERDNSVEVMERVIALEPDHADALNFLGYTMAEEGRDLKQAVEYIRQALEQEPDNPYFLDSLAWAYFKLGKLDLAWREIERCVSHDVTDAVIWEHYGDIAAALGRKAKAAEGWNRALSGKPDNSDEIRKKLEAL